MKVAARDRDGWRQMVCKQCYTVGVTGHKSSQEGKSVAQCEEE